MTYPRRAAGLVKKGRAYYVNDFIIRLSMPDAVLPDSTQQSEVMKMDNRMINTNNETEVLKLYFEPRTWSFNDDCEHNVGSRSFMVGPDGVLAESYMIGDWWYHWTEIVSKTLLLPRNQNCSFTFWLNGGENDTNDEICRFEVIFNNDYEQRLIYNLNRHYIPPVKKLNGWELYEIPFRTQDNEYTQLRFVAQKAYMTVLTAKDAAAYEGLQGSTDPFEKDRPQRHNIVFDDGFPTNKWYSTRSLQRVYKNQADGGGHNQHASVGGQNPEIHMEGFDARGFADSAKQVFDKLKQDRYVSAEMLESVVERSSEQVRGMMENAMQNLRSTLQRFSSEMQASTNIRLDQLKKSLDALSSTCDMLENFDVEVLVDGIRIGEEESDEDIDYVVSNVSDSLSDMADELRDGIEEIEEEIEEIRDVLSM